jgi:nicotinamide mononucleotide transporter
MTWTPLEFAANAMTAICIFLAGRNSIHTWWTGIVACVLFMVLFFNVQLYADATLQVFFMVTGVIGWLQWRTREAEGTYGIPKTLPITNADPQRLWVMGAIGAVVGIAYGFLLHQFTDAYAPWIDSLVLVLSVVAQLLLMRRNGETWIGWVAVNTLAVPLFWSRELYLTSVMYGFFWVNAVISLLYWKKLQQVQVLKG